MKTLQVRSPRGLVGFVDVPDHMAEAGAELTVGHDTPVHFPVTEHVGGFDIRTLAVNVDEGHVAALPHLLAPWRFRASSPQVRR